MSPAGSLAGLHLVALTGIAEAISTLERALGIDLDALVATSGLFHDVHQPASARSGARPRAASVDELRDRTVIGGS